MLPMPNDYGSNANAAMPNSNGNGNDDGNVKPVHRLIVFFGKIIMLNRIFSLLQLFTVVLLLCRVSSVLAPARPFPGVDTLLQLCLNPVDCFLESFVFKRLNFKLGPGYC